MIARIKQIQLFLGPARSRAVVVWLGVTGLASLMLNAIVNQYEWVRPVQTLIVFAFVVGTGIIFISRLPPEGRARWSAIFTPALIAVVIAVFIAPHLSGLLVGGALGWVVAVTFLSRSRMPMAYKEAVRHLRKNRYAEAVKVMDDVIKAEPNEPNHYRFRAEVLRVWGKLDRAQRDYLHMTRIAPESAVAFNGLAEVYMQSGDFPKALDAARRANQLEPENWVTFYNLGMIEDRLRLPTNTVEHLERSLALKVRENRHRALIHFYLARAYARLGDLNRARDQVDMLRKQAAGLEEWEKLLASDQADTLRRVLGADIEAAQKLAGGELDVAALGRGV